MNNYTTQTTLSGTYLLYILIYFCVEIMCKCRYIFSTGIFFFSLTVEMCCCLLVFMFSPVLNRSLVQISRSILPFRQLKHAPLALSVLCICHPLCDSGMLTWRLKKCCLRLVVVNCRTGLDIMRFQRRTNVLYRSYRAALASFIVHQNRSNFSLHYKVFNLEKILINLRQFHTELKNSSSDFVTSLYTISRLLFVVHFNKTPV